MTEKPRVRVWSHLPKFVEEFRRNANGLALRYGGPVYLVGGALTDEAPRDYDVRIIVPRNEFNRLYDVADITKRRVDDLYEYTSWEWRRGYDNLKQSRIMSSRMWVCVDLQIQSEQEANNYLGKPRLRLDSAPAWVLKAGRKDRI